MAQGQQQQQQQGGGADNSLAPFWIILFAFCVAGVIWYVFHDYIVAFVFKAKLWQAYLANIFSAQLTPAIAYLKTVDPTTVDFKQFAQVSDYVGAYMRAPVMLILAGLAVWLYISNMNLHFRRTHTVKTLREQEQETWPLITPVTSLNLVEQDINEGPWATALSPIEFCRKHELLEKSAKQTDSLRGAAQLKRNLAKSVLTLQLGPYWQGIDALPEYYMALFAIFAAHMHYDTEAAANLLKQINQSIPTGKLDFSGAKELLDKHLQTKEVQKIIEQHAYVLTVMASLLARARNSGVLPCSEFLWLKPLDRRLWYMLSNVGRYTAFSEVAGPFAHWLAEKALARQCLVPMVDEAVAGLELAVQEVKLSPEILAGL